jgi:hypothetical protein
MAIKNGWWIQINTGKTEASSITFMIGTDSGNRQPWFTWQSGNPTEIDVPDGYRNVASLYIYAVVSPNGKNGWFCVKYINNGVKHWDFDNDEDHQMDQGDNDDECN